MDRTHSPRHLAWVMTRALEHDLDGVEACAETDVRATQPGTSIRVRPVGRDCSLVMFSQTWRAEELGLAPGPVPRAAIDVETVVITGPGGDACVYVAGQRLYHVASPNRRFFLDLAAQNMRPKAGAAVYEGRDSTDEEAFDYEVAGALARLRTALRHLGAADIERVAERLRLCVAELERAGHDSSACCRGTETALISNRADLNPH